MLNSHEVENHMNVYLDAIIKGARPANLYNVWEEIGHGSYGRINRVTLKENPQQMFAMKRYLNSRTGKFITKNFTELCTIEALQHENIIKMVEIVWDQESGCICMIIPLAKCSMDQYFYEGKYKFESNEISCLLKQLFAAVNYLHLTAQITHGDLKPGNVVLFNDGTLKLIDFGLARSFTNYNFIRIDDLPTTRYRSIELLLGMKKYSLAVDIWSLGCLIFEFFTDRPLFQTEYEMQTVHHIFKLLGSPTEERLPGLNQCPFTQLMTIIEQPINYFESTYSNEIPRQMIAIIQKMLLYNSALRKMPQEDIEIYFEHYPACAKEEMNCLKFDV